MDTGSLDFDELEEAEDRDEADSVVSMLPKSVGVEQEGAAAKGGRLTQNQIQRPRKAQSFASWAT